ncbi:MAG: SDR family oxidoreductase [Anaerolineae bacterium]|nr:SDR family oxidoreductase [Anaerolineae bacterium]
MFDLTGKVVAITGGAGVLYTTISKGLVAAGAKVAILDLNEEGANALAEELKEAGGEAVGVACNVLDRESIEDAADEVIKAFGKVDVLINGAGGNRADATTTPGERSFFDIPPEALNWVFNLNFLGTVLASQVFGEIMAEQGEGVILNTSSMTAIRPLTRVVAYGAAKMAINNLTQWLAVHFAQEYSPNIRVNAIAPGFFLTEQNRYLLTDRETGAMTPRGQQIIDHTPMARYGAPEDLVGTVIWLISDASRFVTGVVVPIDGGFSAYSGV